MCSIPDGDIEIYYSLKPSGRTVPLTEMSTRGGRVGNFSTFMCPLSRNSGNPNFRIPEVRSRPVMG